MIQKSHEARMKLENLGLFKKVGIFIDTSKGKYGVSLSVDTKAGMSKYLTLPMLRLFFSKAQGGKDLMTSYKPLILRPRLNAEKRKI